jgi:hypothetical protein
MRINFMKVHRAFASYLFDEGMDRATLDEWSAKADERVSLHIFVP